MYGTHLPKSKNPHREQRKLRRLQSIITMKIKTSIKKNYQCFQNNMIGKKIINRTRKVPNLDQVQVAVVSMQD
jgi:hypothetical protein